MISPLKYNYSLDITVVSEYFIIFDMTAKFQDHQSTVKNILKAYAHYIAL